MKKTSASEMMKLAKKAKISGKPFKSLSILRDVCKRYPGNRLAREKLSHLMEQLKVDELSSKDPSDELFKELSDIFSKNDFNKLVLRVEDLLHFYPKSFLLWNIDGMMCARTYQLLEAKRSFLRAIEENPDYKDAHNNLANILKEEGRLEDAIYHYDIALSVDKGYVEAITNRSIVLKNQLKLDESIIGFKTALKINPKHVNAIVGISSALQRKEMYAEAMQAANLALRIDKRLAEAHAIIGDCYSEVKKFDSAISSYTQAFKFNPQDVSSASQVIHLQRQMCFWNHSSETLKKVLSIDLLKRPAIPFSSLCLEDNPRNQLLRSINHVKANYKKHFPAGKKFSQPNSKRIRVGYLSADFHDHATMHLMSGLLRSHNTEKFEIFGYSYGRNKAGADRQKVQDSVEHFFDIQGHPDSEIVDLCKSHNIDIAIDLKGYTKETKSEIFKSRLAPVQINFLGYPGSMGADFIDFIIADEVTVPHSFSEFYSENIIRLPGTYQPNDNMREISEGETFRAEFGLPDSAFVFCCFNNNYKISKNEFDIWMRILAKVKGSVIWLFKSNAWVEKNLRREAENFGIDPTRLIFAESLPHSEHLARHKHADLFIDTFNYNAHTTASDALWAGLPVVTKQGTQFSARVASSLLHAVGLPELVTVTEEAYENLIIELATNPERLTAIRNRLWNNRKTEPLFDTKRYTRNFEQGLEIAYQRHLNGDPPLDIRVAEV